MLRGWLLGLLVLGISACNLEATLSSSAAGSPHSAQAAAADQPAGGYWLAGGDGGVFAFGDAGYYGNSVGTVSANQSTSTVTVVSTPDGNGYWLANANGAVGAFGDAKSFGSAAGLALSAAIVGMAASPDGGGYWEVAQDGGVFAFGDANYSGSLPGEGIKVHDIVGMAADADGGGYWLVGSDGGVFAFGNAQFQGSLPASGVHPAAPIVAMASTGGPACPRTTPPSPYCLAIIRPGYWLAGADGGIFAFGSATYYGSLPAQRVMPAKSIVGIAATPDRGGYWLTGADGGIFTFGDATYDGSLPGDKIKVSDVMGIAATP